jgi:hypothetical protein
VCDSIREHVPRHTWIKVGRSEEKVSGTYCET